jgi:NAD(P)-dependent dehydrogenase (short-subunit alcohol dehydrogenase family)
MLDVTDRTVVITGGATGIGFGLAKAFGARGANVVIGEPRQARLDQAVSTLVDSGIKARAIQLDVTDPEQLSDFAEQAFTAFGEVAVVINNAGIGQARGAVIDTPVQELQRVMAVNFEGCLARLPRIRPAPD